MRYGKKLFSPTLGIGFLLIAAMHLGLALLLKWRVGLDIEADSGRNTWDFFWQTIPMADLRKSFWASLWHLHAQPPLFNVYGLVLRRLFGGDFLQAMHYVNILLGAAMCGLMYPILLHLTRRGALSFCAAVVISLNPSIFLYEAFILYTIQVAFLVTLLAYLSVRFSENYRPPGSTACWRP